MIETVPPITADRIKKGLITRVSGFVHYRSFFSCPDAVAGKTKLMEGVTGKFDLTDKLLMVTQFSRV